MQIGISLPNIGPNATPEAIYAIADKADELGFDTVWTSDHLALPRHPALPYPYSRGTSRTLDANTPILDPLAVMAAVAGRTKRVKICVGVLVLPIRHPLVTAKLVSAIDQLSGGRVILGVGTGWIPEEFAAAGVSIKQRGAMTDEQIRYLREVWSQETPEFAGRFYSISDMSVEPKPVRRGVPIWVGGNTDHAMRRAAALGDGLHMIDLTNAEAQKRIAQFQEICRAANRPLEHLTLSVFNQIRITKDRLEESERNFPITGNLEQVIADLQFLQSLGVQHVAFSPRPRGMDVPAYLRVMEMIAREIIPAVA